MTKFTVDTHIFSELGELLVGRESTALVELIKNSYDADSRAVIVEGTRLDDPEHGRITIVDNGTGMTEDEFENGFLRIATRIKLEGSRRSPVFNRRFTGEKGIGRLALHKLARHAQIKSYKWNKVPGGDQSFSAVRQGLEATIDWDLIETKRTLDQIEESQAVRVQRLNGNSNDHVSGTTITLTRLRKKWLDADIAHFHDDVATLVPPEILVREIPESVLSEPSIFSTPRFRDFGSADSSEFALTFLGSLALSEDMRASSMQAANWILEVDCDAEAGTIRYFIGPTLKTKEEYPDSESRYFERHLPKDDPEVSFQARILQRSLKTWPRRHQGIRIYMEGFRVLPYGEPTDDWLDLNLDYTSRGVGRFRSFETDDYSDIVEEDAQAKLVTQPNAAYFGAVFLTHDGAPRLRMLVNREGFLPGPDIAIIQKHLRVGIDLLVRLRYATTKLKKRRLSRDAERQIEATKTADVREQPSAKIIQQDFFQSRQAISDARAALSAGDPKAAEAALERTAKPMSQVEGHISDIMSEASMLRILASVGTEMNAFAHEINGLLEIAVSLERQLDKILHTFLREEQIRAKLKSIRVAAHDLRQSLERQSVYLVDITSVDARRRRSRQLIADRFDSALKLLKSSTERRGIVIENHIEKTLRSPPMFPAELTAIFTNLLSNAVKFGNKSGRIRAWGEQSTNEVCIRVENTGDKVDPEDSDKWFEPFRSTTTQIDARLGQGMGLGLTIARSMLEEYGARIVFVKPSPGFDTALEIIFRDR